MSLSDAREWNLLISVIVYARARESRHLSPSPRADDACFFRSRLPRDSNGARRGLPLRIPSTSLFHPDPRNLHCTIERARERERESEREREREGGEGERERGDGGRRSLEISSIAREIGAQFIAIIVARAVLKPGRALSCDSHT